ncbi:hypothetical protein AB0P21_26465 [Kribbella sp. NPDC056861]|uniref:hypothetical protein n=1 Tax=Kribbella sp. NPDC056861 TaxID=3154857 RepID=UPI00342788CC
MTKQLPAERPLPHKQEILERILADEVRPTHRRPWLVPAAAAASIAVIAGGLVFATSGGDREPAPGPASGPVQTKSGTPKPKPAAGPADIRINVGPLSAKEAKALAEACVNQDPADPGEVGQISHAFKVRGWGRPGQTENTVLALDKSSGLLLGCVGLPTTKTAAGDVTSGVTAGLVGGDAVEARKRKSVINPTDATHPAVPTDSGGGYYFVDFDKLPDKLATEAWYRVDERVGSMRQRWVIRGKVGPWYVGDAVDGAVFLRSWDESTALRHDEKVRLETQVLDHDGKLLDAPANQKGGGGLTPSPGTTRVDIGTVVGREDPRLPFGLVFPNR